MNNLEYLSAKTYHDTDIPGKPIQGTGTIIASQGSYYLITALHCMRKLDDEGKEIVSPDWKKMSATVYLADEEVQLSIKRIVDVDNDNDWAILEIEKPSICFDYEHILSLSTNYDMSETFGSYGFPHHIDDGIYLEFSPTNQRGRNWRLKDIVNGGSAKSITAEKGCSGMGLFHIVDDRYSCLGIINKSVPEGDFNVMKLVSIKSMARYFPDIYQQSQSSLSKLTSEYLESKINEGSKESFVETSDQELAEQYLMYMKLVQYADAYQAIGQLWKRHPNNEWVTLNYLNAVSLAKPQELEQLQELATGLNYTTPQGVIFVSRAFANNGYTQTAVDIWYNNALKFNDNELDTLFYVESLESPMKEIIYKEYKVVIEGKCVLYDDGNNHRHCLIASDKTLMARTMLGKKKNESFILNIAGESRSVKIIAIFDKYYSVIHRALADVMEQGGNRIMHPVAINSQMTGEEVMKAIFDAAGIDPTVNVDVQLQESYNSTPSFLLNSNADDLLWRYYRFLYTDFQLSPWPKDFKDPLRFRYVNPQTQFVLDLSSLIVLFEKSMNGEYNPTKRFLISNFVYEYVKKYKNRLNWLSYDMHKVLEAGRIFRFSDNVEEDVKRRYDAFLKWMDDYCFRETSRKVLDLPNQSAEIDDTAMMFRHTITLLLDDPTRALLTEDYSYSVLIKEKLLMFNSEEFLGL